jgi:small subunit ribosomal protein S24e
VEIKILEDRTNPLLKRHEYRFEVAHATAATPSRDSVRGEISKLVKAPKDRVIIERMQARYGTATTRGDAVVYETTDAVKQIVRAHILVRNGLREKEVKGPAPATEAPAPAAPTESKPEPKAEPKAEAPAEPKGESKPERKAESKAESKSESKSESKAEAKDEPKHTGESKGEGGKGSHKPRAAKAAKTDAAAPAE